MPHTERKLRELEQIVNNVNNIETQNPPYPTYLKDDIKPLVNKRRTSKIREIFESLKIKINMHTKQEEDKSTNERS